MEALQWPCRADSGLFFCLSQLIRVSFKVLTRGLQGSAQGSDIRKILYQRRNYSITAYEGADYSQLCADRDTTAQESQFLPCPFSLRRIQRLHHAAGFNGVCKPVYVATDKGCSPSDVGGKATKSVSKANEKKKKHPPFWLFGSAPAISPQSLWALEFLLSTTHQHHLHR